MLSNKKAQVGETMTWVVATIVIIVILILTIYVALILAKTKAIEIGDLKVKEGEDILNVKTSLAHELANNKNKAAINRWLEEENES